MGIEIHIRLILSNIDILNDLLIVFEILIFYRSLGLPMRCHNVVVLDHPFTVS